MKKLFRSILTVTALIGAIAAQAQQVININSGQVQTRSSAISSLSAAEKKIFENAEKVRLFDCNPALRSLTASNEQDILQLDFFDDKKYQALIEKVTVSYDGITAITAKILHTRFGYCFISVSEKGVSISAELPEADEQFFAARTNGKTYLSQVKMSKLHGDVKECSDVELPTGEPGSLLLKSGAQTRSNPVEGDDLASDDLADPVTIDVLFLYTEKARAWAASSSYSSDIDDAISQAMAKANLVASNSNTHITYRLAYRYKTDYVETNSNDDLIRLQITNDGYMDEAHVYRKQYKADLVMLLSEISYVGGLGYVLSNLNGGLGNPAYGFAFSRVQQITYAYTVIHEIGHNMGCAHHKLQGESGLFSYSYGWRGTTSSGDKVSTIMTYTNFDGTTYPNIAYFSDPNIVYYGLPLGDASDGNNALTVRQSKHAVSRYSDLISPSLTSLTVLADATPLTLKPAFHPDTYSYEVTVPNHISSVNISATASHSLAYMSGTGTKSLNVGENNLTVRVTTAGSNDYTVKITRTSLTVPSAAGIIYIREGGTGNGSSWANASSNLADPLSEAQTNTGIKQIWVAAGTYKPAHKAGDGMDNRDKTFVLAEGLKIYGGFTADYAGTTPPAFGTAERSGVSVLDGENAYHVVVSVGTSSKPVTAATVLDGFTVTGGKADGSGNIAVNGSDINRSYGGGIYNSYSSPTLANLIISGNTAASGGGIHNIYSSPALTGVTVSNNISSNYGGGIYNITSAPELTNVLVTGNQANTGGGIVGSINSLLKLTNVTVSGNTANYSGSGITNSSSSTKYYNTIVYANSVYNDGSSNASEYHNSLVQNTTVEDANGNLNGTVTNPLFVGSGDYRLQPNSPAIDRGNNGYNLTATDLAGKARIAGGTIDLGAYEYQTTYGVSLGSFEGGSVTADKASYTVGETVTLTIATASGYVLQTLSATRTDDAEVAVNLEGDGNTRTFEMPAYGVTVTATFHNPDLEAVTAAKELIEGGTYIVAEIVANTVDEVKEWLVTTVAAFSGMDETEITVTEDDITIENGDFTAAFYGTDGSFAFTVSLSKGLVSTTTASKSGTIIATPIVHAVTPNITAHPQDATVDAGGSVNLSVSADVTDGGTLSYQWYVNDENSNKGGTLLGEKTSASYSPPTVTAGVKYYYVTVTNTNEGVNGTKTVSITSNTAKVTVNPIVDADTPNIIGQPQSETVNEGSSLTLTVTASIGDGGTLTYQWYSNAANSNSGGAAISDATGNSYSPSTATAGTTYYYVVITNTNNGVNGTKIVTATSQTATVIVNILVNAQTPNITAHPQDATVDAGGSALLSVTAGVSDGGTLSYQWYSNAANTNIGGSDINGATGADYSPPTATAGTAYYYVTVTNTNDGVNGIKTASTTSNAAQVTVNPIVDAATPNISVHPQDATVTAGDEVTLSVTANVGDGGTLTYRWYSNSTDSNSDGTAISDATSASYSFSTATAGTTYYYVVITNTNNGVNGTKIVTATSRTATVIVNSLVNAQTPDITAQPQNTTVDAGGSISLSVEANVLDGGTLTYQWYENALNSNTDGTPIGNATNAIYSPPTTSAGTTYYYVTVTNTNDGVNGTRTATATSDPARVIVNPIVNAAMPDITGQPQGATVNVGGSVTLNVTATVGDVGTLTYQWYSNSTDSNSDGTAISEATSENYLPSTATAGTTYYYVVVTNTNNGVNGTKIATVTSHTATVIVNSLVNAQTPDITAHPQDATVDAGGSALLSVTAGVSDGGTLSYQWYSNTANANIGGSTINDATNASYSPPTATAGTTYYYVTVTNTNDDVNGTKTATATSNPAKVTVNPIVDADTPNIIGEPQGATVNEGSSLTLTVTASIGDAGALSYQWYSNSTNSNSDGTTISGATNDSYSPSTATAGTTYYYVVITNTNNGVNGIKTVTATSRTATVIVNSLVNAQTPDITAHPQDATVDVGGSALLNVTAGVSDGGTLSYQWYSNTANTNIDGSAISGATNANYSPQTTAAATTYYYVTVTNTNDGVNGTKTASTTSNAATVIVNPIVDAATPNISGQPQGATVNAGGSVNLSISANVTDGGTLTYQWYSNAINDNSSGTIITGATNTSYSPPTGTAGTTYYYVVVTNTNNIVNGIKTVSINSNVATVTVNPIINADIPNISEQPHDATVDAGGSALLSVTAGVSDGGTLSYQWYSNIANTNVGGATVNGATSASYSPQTTAAGTAYYYVIVTNTNNGVNGMQTAAIKSDPAKVTVNPIVNAVTPDISGQPQGATVTVSGSVTLSVAASVGDGGTLSYQWYSNTTNSNIDGTAINDATNASYSPSTVTAGTTYYYVTVTNTNNIVNGSKIATATSRTATVTVNSLVNAQTPDITAQPQDATVDAGGSTNLSVSAGITDGGTLSYQWYSNTANTNIGGSAVSGAVSASYSPLTTAAGTTYYYVVITNTNDGVNGTKTATATSNPAKVTVNPIVNAETPNISGHPQGAAVTVNGSITLSVTASIGDGGTLTCQWYSNTANSNSGGTIISGATGANYSPSTVTAGTTYYYAVVTNTNNIVNGIKTATATSHTATVTVNSLVNARTPNITTQPQDATVDAGTGATLSVSANVTDGGMLSCQWYENALNSNTDGTPIGSATNASYSPQTTSAGTTYYYVVITNTNDDASGTKTATATSNPAKVTVNPIVNAATPNISGQPQGATVTVSGSITLSVTASGDDGTLTYQWYSNTANSNSGGAIIGSATSASYSPSTATAGTTYYYVVITNTNNGVNGTKTAMATSHTATVIVNSLVNAQTPNITTQPQDATVDVGADANLSVSADVTDGGTLSYQWYGNTANTNIGGSAINGAINANYSPSTTAADTMYYYVTVTNTNNSLTGTKTATATSNPAKVTVNPIVDAVTPNISGQPQGATVTVSGSITLSVTASVGDAGTLSYQWYSNTTNSNTSGTAIGSATGINYSPPTATAGTTYYYVAVTNTNNSVNGTKTATATSQTATVTVNSLVNAQTPNITAQPQDATAIVGGNANISVSADVTDGGTLSYQWYSNTANTNIGGSAISGATSASYSPSTIAAGTAYYYVAVTNTNNSVGGTQTAIATSNPAKVTVNPTVNAAAPNIIGQPQGTTTNVGGSITLSITASVGDGGTLSYQWYGNVANSNTSGTAISSATGANYSPPTATEGTTYYYVTVTNTDNSVNGTKTATVTSRTAIVIVNNLANARTPNISTQPQSATVNVGRSANLLVSAYVTDDGTLSYQWYSNTENTNTGGSAISDAVNTSYSPSTATASTKYYYVAVTNTNNSVSGTKTVSIKSNPARVTVNTLVNAQAPNISEQPQSVTVNDGENATLSVTASVGDGGTLSCQWYRNTVNSNSGGLAISGATSTSYSPSTATAGTIYYYVAVTNTNSSVSGTKTATTTSNAASVTVVSVSVIDAETPYIDSHPQDTTVETGGNVYLSVSASVGDGGTLSYQWYGNSTAISGATNASYSPSTATAGISYYYVEVTNTNTSVNGVQTATVSSYTAAVTVNTLLPATYAITIAPTTNGTVTASASAVVAGETITLTLAPAAGYELDAVAAYSTGIESTTVVLIGMDNIRTFTMPAYGVTVTATFKKTQAQLDREAVAAAKAAIEGGMYRIAQATGNTAADIRTWLINTLNILYGSSRGIQFRSGPSVIADVTVTATAFTPAVEGTESAPAGTNGSFTFTVSLAKGASNETTAVTNGVIVATPHASMPVYNVSLMSGEYYTFTPATVGYEAQSPYTVMATNTGNRPTGELAIALGGANADAFTLSTATVGSLETGRDASFSVAPKTGLAAGSYTATVTIGNVNIAAATITISFTVNEATGTENVQAGKLTVVPVSGGLLVSGLVPGEQLSAYNLQGQLFYKVKATASEQRIDLRERGIYVVVSGEYSVKVIY